MGKKALDQDVARVVEDLAGKAQVGQVTLVLGAGVSFSRKVPSWASLAKSIWRETFNTSYPFVSRSGTQLHPFAHQFALELVEQELSKPQGLCDADQFAAVIARAIYKTVRRPSSRAPGDTLGILARVLRREAQKGSERRIQRVITFNVDSLLEDEVNRGRNPREQPRVWPMARASDALRYHQAIPVYHLHGYLPYSWYALKEGKTAKLKVSRAKRKDSTKKRSDHQLYDPTSDVLVFTDSQYWKMSTTPASFANRILSTALHDSHCVFIGLSFTDLNLVRWLGMGAVEREMDLKSEASIESRSSVPGFRSQRQPHFWIKTENADPGGLISRLLEMRGVNSIRIDSWQSRQFDRVMEQCFPTD